MNRLRAITFWTIGHLRHSQQTSCRILGAARVSTFNSSESNTGQNLSLVHDTGISKHRFHPRFNGLKPPRKSQTYWSAIAAGLLGLGGATLLSESPTENIFTKIVCPKAHCACDEKDCVERECDTSDCLRKTNKEEEMIQKANAELERALRDTKSKAVQYTENALVAYCEAIEAIKLFMNKVYCAVEEDNLDSPRFEEVWCDVYQILVKRCDLAKTAMEKGQCAWELLRRLREIIANGKACQYTSCNPLLVTAEETLICAEKELCSRKAMMDTVMKESRVVEQYRNVVEDFRRDLKAEADTLLPSEECRVTLNEHEANMALTHVYKKILRVQMEMKNSTGSKC